MEDSNQNTPEKSTPFITPHPKFEQLSRSELVAKLAEIDGLIESAKTLKDQDPFTWYIQQRRSCSAELGRRNGGVSNLGPRQPLIVNLSEVQREEVTWLWQDRIPRGKLTLFDGDPGVGKSWLTLAVATAISRGAPLPLDGATYDAGKVLIMTAEDGLGDTIRPRLEDMGASLSNVAALKGMTDEKSRERVLTRLRGFAGVKARKWLKNQPMDLKGLHYKAVAEVAWTALIFGGDCAGSRSLSLSSSNWSSASGWV